MGVHNESFFSYSPAFFQRVTDEVFNFLLVWYYCTLTIRESILISNGSRYDKMFQSKSNPTIHLVGGGGSRGEPSLSRFGIRIAMHL